VLKRAPAGRVLFVRSAVPLVYGEAWWRPHTHIVALTPLMAGREIVNGTFTHPSPVAALLYRGDAGRGAVTTLVEQLDGHALFGRPLEALDAATLNAYADRLGVSAVVVFDQDLPRLRALEDNPVFPRRVASPPIVVSERGAAVPLPQEVAPGRWRMTLAGDGWVSARMAYYPLWRAEGSDGPLPTRRGEFGELEIKSPVPGVTVGLVYGPGLPESLGVVLSVTGLVAWAGLALGWRATPDRSCG
jgi:hypothetical protein